jgi:hypothetical protein
VTEARPEAAALAVVGSMVLLGSTISTWFSVRVDYGLDVELERYSMFLRSDQRRLHDFTSLGWGFEVATVLAGVVALVAILYGSVVTDRMKATAWVLISCGAVALAVVIISWITFEYGTPRDGLGGEVQQAPGAILAALSGGSILVSGLLHRRRGPTDSTAARRTAFDGSIMQVLTL